MEEKLRYYQKWAKYYKRCADFAERKAKHIQGQLDGSGRPFYEERWKL